MSDKTRKDERTDNQQILFLPGCEQPLRDNNILTEAILEQECRVTPGPAETLDQHKHHKNKTMMNFLKEFPPPKKKKLQGGTQGKNISAGTTRQCILIIN